jgi:dipeptidyl aminopeptidase/acylaminoacyl peptidase
MTDSKASHGPATPFHDLDHYVALPRVSGLALSADGARLVTTVATLDPKSTSYTTALWELDPAGKRAARRITRSAKGESGAAFLANGDLLFTSSRPDPENGASQDGDEEAAALWKLPAQGGEARVVLSRPGGITGITAARDADTAVVAAEVLPGSRSEEDDAGRRKARKDRKVGAILHSGYPVRYWDMDLGPGEPHFFAVETGKPESLLPATVDAAAPLKLRDITAGAGPALREAHPVLSPDGTAVFTKLTRPRAKADDRWALARIDVATGERRVILEDDDAYLEPGPVSPDGRTVVVVRETVGSATTAPRTTLELLPVDGGEPLPLAADWDRWPHPWAWLPDGSAVVVTADDNGRAPVFIIEAASGQVRQVTRDDAAYTDVAVAPDGRTAYALRSSYEFPPEAVRIDLATGETVALPAPAARPKLPGRIEEVETTTADGRRVRGWLALPEGADLAGVHPEEPTPLLVWIHGGPLSSWNSWSWRWNPWLLAAKGYAVLLPDPALSTGYGQDFIQRGWGQWGGTPYTDLMAITDAVLERPDLDETRTAAMGGSFGGYMANWVAGQTDRFNAIVTHASLWALDQFGPTTDYSHYWEREMTPEMAARYSPHHNVAQIGTPMLVVHGDKDYRVPISEGLRLWYELLSKSRLAADASGATAHRFLYFPDENHWVLKPQHVKVWYSVVENFLARHVLGEEIGLPAELGL